MYGPDFSTSVFAGPLTAGFEGAARPGHFDGVATVIVKLVNAIEPTTLYLGQKDVQQAVVVRRMLADLDFPVDLVVAPTVREGDGLALSSRNIYLSSEERKAAPSLYRAVDAVARRIAAGEGTLEEALAAGRALLEPPLVWEYLSAVDPQRFVALEVLARPAIVVAVARAGSVRLLDNLPVAGLDGVDPIVTPPARGARVLLT
jgi:pantoate--beta-alanine ligase